MSDEKIVVNANELTLWELGEIADAAGTDPDAPARAGDNFRQIAAMAWAVKRRSDPTFTYQQALELRMADIDLGEPIPPDVAALAANGESPRPSPVPGTSTP